MKKIRLAKIICHSGYCSRAEAEKIIKMGRVTIDDNPYAEFIISDSQIGRIKIDGKPIQKLSLKVCVFTNPKDMFVQLVNNMGKKVSLEFYQKNFQE